MIRRFLTKVSFFKKNTFLSLFTDMKNIFEQKSEMEAEKRKLDKRLKNISVINNENPNNTSFKVNISKQNIPEVLPAIFNNNNNIINNNNNINNNINNRFLEELGADPNILNSNLTAKLELENFKSRVFLQQKSLFEELETLKLIYLKKKKMY